MMLSLSALILAAFSFSAIRGNSPDPIEQAQSLMAKKPRPDTQIENILEKCDRAGNKDYRISLLLGLLARDQRRLADAELLFQTAHQRAPKEIEPLFEMALTQEWRGELPSAEFLYKQLLTQHPGLRSALLGLARVERAQYDFAKAESIYNELLKKDPDDLDAQAGLAWIAMANKQVKPARTAFTSILAKDPTNEEAQVGLKQLANVWRYQLDVLSGFTHNSNGSSATGGADLQIALDAFNTIEIGSLYNSNELPSQTLTQQVFLPTNDTRLGYYYSVPQDANFSLTYDLRTYQSFPTENWLEAIGGTYIGKRFQWIGGIRGDFGSPRWNNILFRLGGMVNITDTVRVGVTGFYDDASGARLPPFNTDVPSSYSFSTDLYYDISSRTFLNLGVGYNPSVDNLNFHFRFQFPLTSHQSIITSFEHDSINNQFISNLGLRFNW